jgi:fructose-bisphosphate aldolase, class II
MLLNMKEMLTIAEENNFAVPAFNICSYAMFNGIMDISEQKKAPTILEIHPDELKHMGTDIIAAMIKRASKSSIPVVIHLDHGSSFQEVMVAIRAGFTSVMIDGSALPIKENMALCKKVVEAAHFSTDYEYNTDPSDDRKEWDESMSNGNYSTSHYAKDVSVEGELGNIGVTDELKAFDQVIHYTQPDEAVQFIKETGIDTLAIAIGTCHGIYPEGYKPELKLDLLKDIRNAIKDAGLETQLVLHGGSNNPDDEIATSTKTGVRKINISSDIKVAYYKKMREVLADPSQKEPCVIEPPCIKAMQECAAQKIDLFSTAGKAGLYR